MIYNPGDTLTISEWETGGTSGFGGGLYFRIGSTTYVPQSPGSSTYVPSTPGTFQPWTVTVLSGSPDTESCTVQITIANPFVAQHFFQRVTVRRAVVDGDPEEVPAIDRIAFVDVRASGLSSEERQSSFPALDPVGRLWTAVSTADGIEIRRHGANPLDLGTFDVRGVKADAIGDLLNGNDSFVFTIDATGRLWLAARERDDANWDTAELKVWSSTTGETWREHPLPLPAVPAPTLAQRSTPLRGRNPRRLTPFGANRDGVFLAVGNDAGSSNATQLFTLDTKGKDWREVPMAELSDYEDKPFFRAIFPGPVSDLGVSIKRNTNLGLYKVQVAFGWPLAAEIKNRDLPNVLGTYNSTRPQLLQHFRTGRVHYTDGLRFWFTSDDHCQSWQPHY